MKNLFMALLAFFGFGHAAAQEPPKTKQKPKTVTDTTKTRKAPRGGVKKIDTVSAQPVNKKKSKSMVTKDTVSVKE